jgi:hypothetical protein
LAHAGKLEIQFRRLGLDTAAERLEAVRQVLAEARPDGYVGRRPPEEAAEEGFEGCELFAFVVESRAIGCRTYLKFVLRGETLGIVSFHESEERRS